MAVADKPMSGRRRAPPPDSAAKRLVPISPDGFAWFRTGRRGWGRSPKLAAFAAFAVGSLDWPPRRPGALCRLL